MNNVTANSTTNQSNSTAGSYVDAYVPPQHTPSSIPSIPMEPVTPPAPVTPVTPVPSVASVEPVVGSVTTPTQKAESNKSEELEDQNIFFMLGVLDGSPEQRESFLDELQQVIWEDFLEFDVKLLITKDEQVEVEKLLAQTGASELEKQEKIVVYLEKLIPDLEEIMLEKALELKEEMARERVKGMRDFYKDNQANLQKLETADQLMNSGKWFSAAQLLNSIGTA